MFKDLNDASSGTHGYFGAYLTNADRKGGALCGIVSLGDGSDKDASCEVTRLFICPPEGVSEGSFIGRVPACLRTAAGRYLHTQKIMHRLPPLPFFLSPPPFFFYYIVSLLIRDSFLSLMYIFLAKAMPSKGSALLATARLFWPLLRLSHGLREILLEISSNVFVPLELIRPDCFYTSKDSLWRLFDASLRFSDNNEFFRISQTDPCQV